MIEMPPQRRAYRQKNGRKPRFRVNVRPPAGQYVNADDEKVIEFFDPSTGLGGLIQFCRFEASLGLCVYRHDSDVFVTEGKKK